MYQCLRQHREVSGEKAALVALGPLTNIAVLLSLYPEITADIDEVIVLAGGITVGNVTVRATLAAPPPPQHT